MSTPYRPRAPINMTKSCEKHLIAAAATRFVSSRNISHLMELASREQLGVFVARKNNLKRGIFAAPIGCT